MAARLPISIAERHDLNHEPGVSIAHPQLRRVEARGTPQERKLSTLLPRGCQPRRPSRSTKELVQQLVHDVEDVLGFSAGHWLHDISVCCIVAELTDEVGRTHQVPPDQLPFCECGDLRFDPSHDDVEVLGRCLDDRTRYGTRTYVSMVRVP